jgi:putative FmdB family regulatory protein
MNAPAWLFAVPVETSYVRLFFRMPTYGYECLACNNEFEVFQSIKDDPLTTCSSCGGSLRKRIYPVGIAFKGPGFHVNDYGKKPKSSDSKAAATSDTPVASADSKTDSAATEPVKPETKSEPAKTADTKTTPAPASA